MKTKTVQYLAQSQIQAIAVVAQKIVDDLYTQGDTQIVQLYVREIATEIAQMPKVDKTHFASGYETIKLIPGPVAALARKWYRELHDKYQRETDDDHYVSSIRRISSDVLSIL